MNGKVEENIIFRDQELNSLSHCETIRKRIQPQGNRLPNEPNQVPSVLESGHYHINSTYENVGLRKQEHVGISAVSETAESCNYNLNSFYENVRLDNQELRDGSSAVLGTTGSIDYHIYPAYENASFEDQELHLGKSAVSETAERDNYHIYPAYENASLDDQELHVGKSAITQTIDRGNYHIYPAYKNARFEDQELHDEKSSVSQTAERGNFHIYPAYENASLDDQEFHIKMPAVPKTSESDNNYKNLVYENVGLENQELRVGMSDVPETTESINFYIYPACENIRFSDQEGMSAVTQTAERDSCQIKNVNEDAVLGNQLHAEVSTFPEIEESNRHYINSGYECARLDDQELRFRMPAVSETAENRNCHIIKPNYETVILGDQELKPRSYGQMVHKSIQLHKRDLMLNPNYRMSLGPRKTDSVDRFKCHINPSDNSTLINQFTVDACSANQEQKLNFHREMISKSIQLPERVDKTRTRMPFGHKKNNSHERFNFHINLAYESPVKISCTVEEDAKPHDQELNSHRAMIRKSIQLPEKGPKREPRVKMSVVSASEDFKESGHCHINLAYESSWDLNGKVGENTSSNYQEEDRIACREIIRRSIQVPERQQRPRKLCCCSIT